MRPYLLMGLLALWLCGCMNLQKIPVESDYSYEGDFQEYQTFNFFTNLESNSDQETNSLLIKKAINDRMRILGYRFNDENPDISVAISFFQKETKFPGFGQPEIDYWVNQRNDEAKYQPVNYKLYQGTLLIQFIDNKSISTIWQGYSSGGYGTLNQDDTRKINHAVWQIMDRYKVFAKRTLVSAEVN